MKAWKTKTKWQHKKSLAIYDLNYIVVTEDDDPIHVLKQEIDFTGLNYIDGKIEAIKPPFVCPN